MIKEVYSVDNVIRQEHNNFLSNALRPYFQDFQELKAMEQTQEVTLAMVDTMESIFKVLKRNGINL